VQALAGFGTEPALQGARAHVGLGRHPVETQRVGEMIEHPRHDRRESSRGRPRRGHVLGLSADAVRWADEDACDVVGVRLSVVEAQDVQAQVGGGEHPAGGQDGSIVDVQRALEQLGVGELGPELVGQRPVRRDASTGEHAGLAEDEGSGTQRDHAGATRGRRGERREQLRLLADGRSLEARHDDGVGVLELGERSQLGHREAQGGAEAHGAADADVVGRLGLLSDLAEDRGAPPERLCGDGQVEHERARKGHDHHAMCHGRSCPELIDG